MGLIVVVLDVGVVVGRTHTHTHPHIHPHPHPHPHLTQQPDGRRVCFWGRRGCCTQRERGYPLPGLLGLRGLFICVDCVVSRKGGKPPSKN